MNKENRWNVLSIVKELVAFVSVYLMCILHLHPLDHYLWRIEIVTLDDYEMGETWKRIIKEEK